jgi:hypothetical protein
VTSGVPLSCCRYCKFGTLQYCVVRPATTFLAMVLDVSGAYHEPDLSFKYGYVYILIIMNVSIFYAFIVLASFYSAMKVKLKPYEPVGKFLCIKFVIFFAFWQGVVITGLMKMDMIAEVEGYDARQVSVGIQNFLICIEMFVAAVAFTYTFSYEPFVEGYVNPKLAYQYGGETEYDEEHAAVMEGFMRSNSAGSGGGSDRAGSGLPYHVDPQRSKSPGSAGKSSKGTRSKGLLNMVRSGRSSRPPGAGKKGTANDGTASSSASYQLVPMPAEDSAHGDAPDNQQSRRIGSGTGPGSRDRRHENAVSQQSEAGSDNLLNKHFAADAAIRDFNETMPLVVLPSGFEMHRGLVVNSDPQARLRALEEEEDRRKLQEEAVDHL